MPKQRPTLLLTRPEQASRRFAGQFAARFGGDWPILIAPLMQIVPLAPDIPSAEVVIFTSENAVAPFTALSPAAGRFAYCVGGRTARAAAAAGFRPLTGPGDASGLFAMICADPRRGPMVHARGRHLAADLADMLNNAGIETKEALVYDQREVPLTTSARDILGSDRRVLVPLFSPRSAALFAAEAAGARAQILCAPISAAAADRCLAVPGARMEVAATPDAAGVLDALARLIGLSESG